MELMRPMKFGGEQLVFGENALAHLERLQGKRAMILISGQRFCHNGVVEKIGQHLAKAGMEYRWFDGVTREPDYACICQGGAALADYAPDVIIALGGGSVLDAAKLMWLVYEHPEIDTLEKLEQCHNRAPRLRQKAYLVEIPTTSGTASECSRSAVLTDAQAHRKVGISDMQFIPDVAILDPSLTYSLPPSLTAETGMDALTHAVEAYFSLRANLLSDVFAVTAAEYLFENLPIACEKPEDFPARNAMQLGSYLAGMAFSNVSLGICHSIAHTLGGEFHLAHGLLNAILLPAVVEFNLQEPDAARKASELERRLQVTSLPQALRQLNSRLGIPTLASQIDRDTFYAKLPQLAQLAQQDGCTKTNPRKTTAADLQALMERIYEEVSHGN